MNMYEFLDEIRPVIYGTLSGTIFGIVFIGIPMYMCMFHGN